MSLKIWIVKLLTFYRVATVSARGAVMCKTARNAVKLRYGEFREQCFDNSGEKVDVCK